MLYVVDIDNTQCAVDTTLLVSFFLMHTLATTEILQDSVGFLLMENSVAKNMSIVVGQTPQPKKCILGFRSMYFVYQKKVIHVFGNDPIKEEALDNY